MQIEIEKKDYEPHHKKWRLTLAVMFIAQFLSGTGFSFIIPFLPFYFKSLGITAESENLLWVGWSSMAFGITMAVFAPLWGIVADKYGRKLMVLRSMFFGSIVLGLMGFATSPWHLLALRVLQGMTTGTVTASITLVSSVTPATNLGISLGLLQAALLLGQSAGPLLGGFVSDYFGFRVSCFIAFIVLMLGTILVFFGAFEKFSTPGNNPENGFKSIKSILGTKGFKIILVTYFFIYVINFMLTPILPLFIEKLSGSSSNASTITGIFISTAGILAGISSAFLGRIGDRIGHKRVAVFSIFIAGVISIPQAFADNLTILFIERCFLGLAIGGILPSIQTLVSKIIPKEKFGGAYGLTSSVTTLGIGAGPLIGSYLASVMGLRVPFAAMGILAFFVALLINKMINDKSE